MDKYKEHLEQAVRYYHSDEEFISCFGYLPKTRYTTFKYCIDYINSLDHEGLIVELGTSRSFVDGRFPGCNSKDPRFWEPTNPNKWDWSAGHFTRVFSECTKASTVLHTVDLERSHIESCKHMTREYSDKIQYHVSSSENFLDHCKEDSIDLLYLDTGDVNPVEPTALLHLREAQLIVKKNILRKDGLILIDDVKNIASKVDAKEMSNLGKAKYSIPYFLQNGYEIVLDEYQVVLKKST
jgi:hypothetical protein